ELQFSLLPRQFPNVPPGTQSHEGALQFLSLFFPTGNVSGDFFTVIQVCEDSVGVFICDVMGHGVRSALLTTMIRALVEEHAPHIKEADKLLARVNQGLTGILQHSGTMMFATGFYLILDIGSSQINYASAGHPAPFLITHDGGAIELLNGEGSSGPAMGLFAGASYRATQRAVHQGDFIILFTDGLFEVEGASGELFSKEALLDCVKRRISLPPQEILNRMVKEVREFSHEKRFDDDVCVVGVQLRHRG
ncbi:MAG: PP2C family protein-serine/threonine phosphatase, partial [Verrucomicrobiota bacterium]